MGESATKLAAAVAVALALGACKIDLDKAPCPCVAGWECCATTNTCVKPDDPCLESIKDQAVLDGVVSDMSLPDTSMPDAAVPDQKIVPPWVSLFGDPQGGWVRGFGLDVDSKGNSFVTGYFSGTVKFSSTTLKAPILLPTGKEQLFIVKLDPSGKVLWAVSPPTGQIMKATGYSVVADALGYVYVAGSFAGKGKFGSLSFDTKGTDYFVCMLDPSGKVMWAVTGGGNAFDAVKDIELDSKGNIYVTGRFEQTTNIGGVTLTAKGKSALFVARLNPKGAVLWAVSSGGTGSASALTLAPDKAGKKIHVCGSLTGVAVLGSTTLSSGTSSASLVAQLDPSGKFLWATQGKGSSNNCHGVTTDNSGNVYINGMYSAGAILGGTTLSAESMGMFVSRLDSSGKFLWATSIVQGDGWHGIAVDGTGNILATGRSNLSDVLVARLNPAGKVLGTISAGSKFSDIGVDIGVDSAGNVYSMGVALRDGSLKISSGTATFGKLTFNLKGRGHLFVWKMPAF